MSSGKLEHTPRALHLRKIPRRGMNNKREIALRKFERGYSATQKLHRRVISSFWRFRPKTVRVASQQSRTSIQPETFICPDQALHQPCAYEPGSSGDEDVLIAQSLPEVSCARQNVIEILFERMRHALLRAQPIALPASDGTYRAYMQASPA